MSKASAEKKNLKNKASGMFNNRVGVATQSSLKGIANTIQILSLAAKAGLSAASVPLSTAAATADSSTFAPGAIAACEKFREAANKAGREARAKKAITAPGALNRKKSITPSGGDGAFVDDAYAMTLDRLIQTTPATEAKLGATHTFTLYKI